MAHRVQSVSMIDQNILQAIFIGGEVIQYDELELSESYRV